MRSTTKDLRYIEAKDKFLEHTFLAIRHHFDSRGDLNRFFNSIDDDVQKSLFLRTATFYLFLVKRYNWIVEVPCSDTDVGDLTNPYKYVGIFSLTESLSDEKLIDFYQLFARQTVGTARKLLQSQCGLILWYFKWVGEFLRSVRGKSRL